MQLRLYNTPTRTDEAIVCPQNRPFGIYCCGPTVYGPAHVGNFRTYIVQDSVLRLLKLLKIPFRYVRNLTDVDDKTIRGAAQQHQSLSEYTQHWIDIFEADCLALHLLPPTVEPKATETIQTQQDLIQTLLDRGYAYEKGGSVYFRISAFKSYGRLSHLAMRTLQTQEQNSAGRANDADDYDREHVADFVLWKAYKPEDGDVFWESPWGRGRPGWHTECSAMSHLYLGDTVELHTGGVDLCFPHHENEIAQSVAAYGGPFVKHWMHIAHLKVEGQKMSKSLGNLFTLADLQQKKYSAEVVRYALLTGHYRQPLNFTFALLNASQSALRKIHTYTQHLLAKLETSSEVFAEFYNTCALPQTCSYLGEFFNALLADLNWPKALGYLFSFMHEHRVENTSFSLSILPEWAACLYALGVVPATALPGEAQIEIPLPIRHLAQQRWVEKQARNFSAADDIRHILEESGWKVIDTKDSYHLESL